MTLESTIALAIAAVIFAASPGPGVIAVTSRALVAGFRPAAAMSIGMVAGDFVYLFAALFGWAAIAPLLGDVFEVVRLLSAVYLIWLGIDAWRKSSGYPAATERLAKPVSDRRDAALGFLISVSNPKVILFYIGLLPSFVDLARLTLADGAIVVAVIGTAVTGVMLVYCAMASRSRRLFQSPRAITLIHRFAGTFLIGAGATIATR